MTHEVIIWNPISYNVTWVIKISINYKKGNICTFYYLAVHKGDSFNKMEKNNNLILFLLLVSSFILCLIIHVDLFCFENIAYGITFHGKRNVLNNTTYILFIVNYI